MATRASPLLRRVAGLSLGLCAATALTLAGAWWWAGSEGSLATALRWAPWSALSTEGVTGSLRHGGQARRLAWQSPTLQLEATDITLRWQAQALLSRRLHIEQLAVGSLLITPISSTPAPQAGPPTSLRLPLPFTLDDFSVRQVRRVGTPAFEATDLRGSYAYSNARHQHALTLRQAQVASGRYSFTPNEEYALFTEFKAHGGQAVEVITGSHSSQEAVRYAETALEFGLAASRGSDFHSPDESRIDLGTLPLLPGQLTPVWELLADRIQ